MRRSKASKQYDEARAWAASPAGIQAYRDALLEAQKKANDLRMDHGITLNDVFKCFHVNLLPAAQYRCGSELTCEVVHPLGVKPRPGHGPSATRAEVGKVLTPRYEVG